MPFTPFCGVEREEKVVMTVIASCPKWLRADDQSGTSCMRPLGQLPLSRQAVHLTSLVSRTCKISCEPCYELPKSIGH